ncbi:uncharacterized protein LOC110990503 isoform X3 [Acanthaster planci]|uniref:Uncharacterized protein LOC110990503 isoform X3 n=1 Tax=Acanthaster planci TaxID=133434 RepID=A0A8B8A1K1_ACAPL|nr:uncharacterized protein LOC110990503 isoform X3 [Acanthaster planci]
MSSATVKAQFAPDRPISKRKTVKNKKYTGTSSDSDDSTVKHAAQTPKKCQRRKDQNQPVNGQSSSMSIQSSNQVELIPNLKGLYSICVAKLPQELETLVPEVNDRILFNNILVCLFC